MTASELRELDAWIEEHLFGREVVVLEREDLPTIYKFKLELEYEYVPVHAYSTSVVAFALVKREIERRGWEWACAYERPTEHLKSAYTFTVYVIREPETNAPTCYDKLAASEELAGCLAVKAAVETILA